MAKEITMPVSAHQPLTTTRTLQQQLDELAQIHKDMEQLRTRAGALLDTIASYAGPPGPAYGPIAETFAEDAAVVVDARKATEFAAAPFDGEYIRTQARLVHALSGFRALGDLLVSDTTAAQAGASAQLGNTLAVVVDVT